ncbi:MAG: glutathione S-transferase N-terminal domain-containing protein, partial [Candidatus Colwellbacteria bacterium]|nr:glutathione S-transferase N-terminal domain-containing protein [Candidatus Colwellbacteria bacterium]
MTKITIYTTPSCVYCKMTKEYFEKKDIGYEEKNVLRDNEAREEMIDKSGQLGVPVIDIDGSIVVGFDKPDLEELTGNLL